MQKLDVNKPFRFKRGTIYHGDQIFKTRLEPGGMLLLRGETDGGRRWMYYNNEQAERDLENYEPSSTYEIIGNVKDNYSVLISTKNGVCGTVAWFVDKQDAELFRQAKEQQP